LKNSTYCIFLNPVGFLKNTVFNKNDLIFNKYYLIVMTITIKTRRLRVNKLLARRELLLDVYHEGKPNVSQKDLRELIAAKYHW
jgi:hypothetical protein